MGMSMHVVGIKPPDEKWKQMKAVWDACTAAKIQIPDEVESYFEGMRPDPAGVIVDIPKGSMKEYNTDGEQGFEIDLKTLPADVTRIRFYCAY